MPPDGRSRRQTFQFTPLREGRLHPTFFRMLLIVFQFTPLREGRRTPSCKCTHGSLFQFTPLREGRL